MTYHDVLKPPSSERHTGLTGWALLALLGSAIALPGMAHAVTCTAGSTITANVVVLDNPTVFNRLGAQNPNWITYALERDVVHKATQVPCSQTACTAGNVELRPDKRPRPLVVRSCAGANLTVHFTNLLDPIANPNNEQQGPPGVLINNDQVAGRCAGFHASGTEIAAGGNLSDDGSMVGNNPGANTGPTDAGQANCGPGMVHPGGPTLTYNLHTPHEGAFVINSYGATLGSEASSGNLGIGMFGALNVQPAGSRMYRSKVSEEELRLATADADLNGIPDTTDLGQPIIDYEATYPNVEPWISEGKAGLPILNILTAAGVLVHSDIDAIITGAPEDGYMFPAATYPLESVGANVPSLPNRLEPYREFTSVFHDEQTNSQVFPRWYGNPVLNYTLAGVKDQFMINYGSGGIGSEIIANRLHTGPMHDCAGCAYEEFFLASQTVGDPGLLVNFPANTLIEQCDPTDIVSPGCWRQFDVPGFGPVGANPPIEGNFALHPDDPANVHHAYTGDFVKIRNTHTGAFEQHIFHLHQHQWLFNPNDDNANYLDAQEIMPGSGHTYELTNGGAGNRNKTAGDAIFHCHFYPHFAQGMWYHLRIQDTFERGTVLAASGADDPQNPTTGFHDAPFELRNGQPMAGARALPDGELLAGVPIPAVVPLPGQPMPEMPAAVSVKPVDRGDFGVLAGRFPPGTIPGQGDDSSQAVVDRADVAGPDLQLGTADDKNPGFPFWLAGNECGIPTADDPCPNGTVGQRMPTPPLDMLTEAGATANGFAAAQAGGWDGGLPRHNLRGYTSAAITKDTNSRLDFSKEVEMAQPVYFPELGTDLEQVAMGYHAQRCRDTFKQNGDGTVSAALCDATTGVANPDGSGGFVLNGIPPVPGGPFNDPCVDDQGNALLSGVDGMWFDGDNNQGTQGNMGRSNWSSDNPRTYKIANVQIDAVFNKVGWHYPQERIIALWEDVEPTINKQRPPEPLVMRFNTFDCGKLLHTNLVPKIFELDDFQVRTPTDIIGQHIHLPKWDLTTNDGAANGWNYEDGALSPGMVEERVKAFNEFNHLVQACIDSADPLGTACILPAGTLPGQLGPLDLNGLAPVPTLTLGDGADPGSAVPEAATELAPLPHPFFGAGVGGEYLGARTVIQRILMDPLVNVEGVDRGLGLTFSHDHYGPSTFQQIGLYSTILAEPAGSNWVHNESGLPIGASADGMTLARQDGGPTTWQAIIKPPTAPVAGNTVQSDTIPEHREFYFEMSDFQHAYEAGTYVGAGSTGRPSDADAIIAEVVQIDPFNATAATAPNIQDTWQQTINPPLKLKSVPFPDIVTAEGACPGPAGNADPTVPRPCAEAINISHSSMFVVNYRNEPVGLRVFDPDGIGPDGQNGTQAPGEAGDLAFALQSRRDREIAQLNTSLGDMPYPTPGYCANRRNGDGINCDRRPGDPITPIMRAYEGDDVKIKIQVGATEEQHQATVHGMKWLSNGSGFGRSPNSGWRNFQSHGISEQFSLQVPINPDPNQTGNEVDYLYATDATRDGFWTGPWGILRAYGNRQRDLVELPSNPAGNRRIVNGNQFVGVCPDVDQDGIADNLVPYDVTAVLANDVLPNNLGVAISPNTQIIDPVTGAVLGGDSDGDGIGDNNGGPLNTAGGTLVYNRRGTEVPTLTIPGEGGEPPVTLQGGFGPLNDPTGMMYVRTSDLVVVDPALTVCSLDPLTNPNAVDTNLDGIADTVVDPATGAQATAAVQLPRCPVRLADTAPVEPIALRANAGDCIETVLRNRLPFTAVNTLAPVDITNPDGTITTVEVVTGAIFTPEAAPDLAGWQDMMWIVERFIQVDPVTGLPEMHFFNNNLIRPSSHVGLHAQLVEYDASRDDGVLVGQNPPGQQIVAPGLARSYRWYAGDLTYNTVGQQGNTELLELVATPIEFGASNLLSADRVKQPQKGLFGALSILPAGSTVAEDTQVPDGQGSGADTRLTRAQVTVTAPVPAVDPAGSGGVFRENLAIGHKIANLRWKDGTAIANVNQGELGREGAEDSGFAGFNYGMEPSWFRFKLPPDVPFGNAGTPNSYGSIPNVQAMFANELARLEPNAVPAIAGVSAAGDPQTPVFKAAANQASRIHVLNGASADRDGTFILHGHVWQRDPFVCPGESDLGLTGLCLDSAVTVDSTALGLNPIGKYMGGEEGMGHAYGHWPILFTAGGTGGVTGDYLFRDYAPNGSRNGQFGILRVE